MHMLKINSCLLASHTHCHGVLEVIWAVFPRSPPQGATESQKLSVKLVLSPEDICWPFFYWKYNCFTMLQFLYVQQHQSADIHNITSSLDLISNTHPTFRSSQSTPELTFLCHNSSHQLSIYGRIVYTLVSGGKLVGKESCPQCRRTWVQSLI